MAFSLSENYGFFSVCPRILMRATNFMDLITRHRPGTQALRLWYAASLNDAYDNIEDSFVLPASIGSGPTLALESLVDRTACTTNVTTRGLCMFHESRKYSTTFMVDPTDLLIPDNQLLFVRLQERRGNEWLAVPGTAAKNPDVPKLGPIKVIPNTMFYGTTVGHIIMSGTAPSNTGCTFGNVPAMDETYQVPNPMHIVLPKLSGGIEIQNLTNAAMLVSFGLGEQMFRIVANGSYAYQEGSSGVSEILVAREAGDDGCDFTIKAQIIN